MSITTDRLLHAPNWHLDANCTGLGDAMYPENGDHLAEKAAKKVCEDCPVAADCLGESIAKGDFFGIRAGLTGAERRNLVDTKERRKCVACGALFVPRLDIQKRCRTCSRTYRQAKR